MKNKNLNNIKSTGFKTPDLYFKSLEETIVSKLNTSSPLTDIKSNGFKVPDTYFETLDSKVLNSIHDLDKPKVISLINWKKVAYVSGIAASILLLFKLIFNSSEPISFNNLETASIENYLYQQDLNTLDIVSYLQEEDLVKDNFIDTKVSDESLENYLLENTSLETLILD